MSMRRRLTRRFPGGPIRGVLLSAGVLTAGVVVAAAGPASAGGTASKPVRVTQRCAWPEMASARIICARSVRVPRPCPLVSPQAQGLVQGPCIAPLPCHFVPAGQGAIPIIRPVLPLPCPVRVGLPGRCRVFFVAPAINRRFFSHRLKATRPHVIVLPPMARALRCAGTSPVSPCLVYAGTSVKAGQSGMPGIRRIEPRPRARLVCIGGFGRAGNTLPSQVWPAKPSRISSGASRAAP
jgi:hypothetical protein